MMFFNHAILSLPLPVPDKVSLRLSSSLPNTAVGYFPRFELKSNAHD